ncbi:MBL fold metallo-hydrolase [Pseudonocardia sp. C8]|uniref:MBL fold metallo-hydrolase n=1 Tax=Pseudonocardia sp. C8 TaxID=2762759 RepID=UPI0016426161|nr:MBL fold metallo-hydrolase [Pseudonocardia sp. C8]MBC3194886.1 MBL fold metallo-hydrolase [Pseudonocardia sp. C8]
MSVTYTLVGGATAIVEIAGIRILVDPTFDPLRTYDLDGIDLVKTKEPAIPADEIGAIDAVLITHDHHQDHLDELGKEIALGVRTVVTTTAGAGRLGSGVIGLAPYETTQVPLPDGDVMSITGLPAQHGPAPFCDVAGPVLGFLLEAPGAPKVYLTGDNYSLEVAKEIADRIAPVDIVVMFGGGARFAEIMDGEMITMPNEGMVEVVRLVGARRVVPCHTEGWRHFTEGAELLHQALQAEGLGDRFIPVQPGETVTVEV